MNTIVLITAWWFMATSLYSPYFADGHTLPPSPPVALGPYPTQQMCIAAERLIEPTNRVYWSAADVARWKPYDNEKRAFDTRMAQLAKENPRDGNYKLPDGTYFSVNYGNASLTCFPLYNGYCAYRIGKTVPQVIKPEYLNDTYTVNQTCAPVKGWYTKKP